MIVPAPLVQIGQKAVGWLMLFRDRRRRVLGAAASVANELELNAEVIERYEAQNTSIQSVQAGLSVERWAQHEAELHVIRGPLYTEVSAAYKALHHSKVRGARPPDSGDLRALAKGLRKPRF